MLLKKLCLRNTDWSRIWLTMLHQILDFLIVFNLYKIYQDDTNTTIFPFFDFLNTKQKTSRVYLSTKAIIRRSYLSGAVTEAAYHTWFWLIIEDSLNLHRSQCLCVETCLRFSGIIELWTNLWGIQQRMFVLWNVWFQQLFSSLCNNFRSCVLS